MMLCMEMNEILSVIFVPALSVLFILMLLFMFMRRPSADTVVTLMFELKQTVRLLRADSSLGKKQLKKLDMRVSKLQLLADKASFEDAVDVSVAQSAFNAVRLTTAALAATAPNDNLRYLRDISKQLDPAVDYLVAVTGIDLESAAGVNYKLFSRRAKKEKAQKYLETIDKK